MVRLNSPLADTPNARDYIDIMCEIRKLSLYNALEENTPTIVVFGDQSSGKSSVLHRLTGGLPMPRGTNKCTATPFEIRMLQTEEPLRKISLRYIEDKNRNPITPKEIDFAIITHIMDTEEIEEKLREAQRFVQNPSIEDVDDSTSLPPENDELAFTRNAVCVTISGPEQLYSLSMVDLPGVVRNDEEHETFVLSLVKEYIKKESSILVPIFHASSDIATQCAYRLARDADPSGQRTVGVLTKMDRIVNSVEDDHRGFATLVKGQGEHKLVNGAYVIINSAGSTELEESDELERATIRDLKQHKDWKNVPADRFGLLNLTMKLSELQRKAHERTWPRIRPFLEDRRTEFQDKLNALPPPPTGNPTIHFLELIGKFDKLFTSHANTEHVEHRLYRGQQWNFGQFDQAILNTRPRYKLAFEGEQINDLFDPIKPGSLQCRGWTKKLREEISADDWGRIDDDFSDKYVWDLEELCETVQESQGGQLVGYFPYKAVVNIVARHQKEWLAISTKLLDKNHDWVGQFTDELVDKLFGEYPNALEKVRGILRDLLKQCKDKTLERLKDIEEMEHMSASRALYVTDEASLLKKQSKYFIKYRIFSAMSRGNHELRYITELGSKLFDLTYEDDADEDEFDRIKNELISTLSKDMSESSQKLVEEIRSTKINTEMPSTATMSMMMTIKNQYLDKLIGVVPKSNEDAENQQILRSTISEHAFLAATGALAYWKMAHTKFREIVPRIVEYYLVHKFSTCLGEHLRAYFKLLGSDLDNHDPNSGNLKDLLGEDPENARNREEWQEYIEKLSAIIDKVRKVSVKNLSGSGSGSGSSSSSSSSSNSSSSSGGSSRPRGNRM